MNRLNEPLNRREFLKRAAQTTTAAMAASAGVGSVAVPLLARAGEAARPRPSRISYYCNGEIHVNEVGKPEGKPLTSPPVPGQEDFKPSWSKTGDMLSQVLGPAGLTLDYERIKAERPRVAQLLKGEQP